MNRAVIIALVLLAFAAAYAYFVQPGRFPSTGGKFTPRDGLIRMNDD